MLPKFKSNFNAGQFIFGKHKNYQRLNDFWKFGDDQKTNIEVI